MKKEISIKAIDENYVLYTLKNNLKVYVYDSPEISEYYAAYTTYYGSNFDVIAGSAHFLEHSLFAKEDGDLFTKFAKNGASVNAFTSNHQTTYYFTSDTDFVTNFNLLQRLVNESYFTNDLVNKEMGIIEEEIMMYAQSSDTKIRNTTFKNACIDAKYGIDIAGDKSTINTLTPEILCEIHQSNYVPSNQSIVLSGNFENIDVISLIKLMEDKVVNKTSIIETSAVNKTKDVIIIEDINVDMFTHTYKFNCNDSMLENIKDYIALNTYLSTYFTHVNPNYVKYKDQDLFSGLLEHSVVVTPSLKMLYFEMNYGNDNENIVKKFREEIKLDINDLAKGLIKIKAYEIRQVNNKKVLMENVMYSLSDDFEYSDYIDVLFDITVEEIHERIINLFNNCNEATLIFKK